VHFYIFLIFVLYSTIELRYVATNKRIWSIDGIPARKKEAGPDWKKQQTGPSLEIKCSNGQGQAEKWRGCIKSFRPVHKSSCCCYTGSSNKSTFL